MNPLQEKTGYSLERLLEMAVENVPKRKTKYYKRPYWVAVRDLFHLSSQNSAEICRYFGKDPNEMI